MANSSRNILTAGEYFSWTDVGMGLYNLIGDHNISLFMTYTVHGHPTFANSSYCMAESSFKIVSSSLVRRIY